MFVKEGGPGVESTNVKKKKKKKTKQNKTQSKWNGFRRSSIKGYWLLLLVPALPTGCDDLLSSPEIAKLLADSPVAIPLQSESGCGKGLLADDGPGATDVGGLPAAAAAALRLLPGGLVIMAVTEAGMDNPVVWFM